MPHPAIDVLTVLDDLDREIIAARRTIAEQPKVVEARRSDLEEAKAREAAATQGIKELEARNRLLEKEIQGHQGRIKEIERKLNEVKTNVEYQALKKTIANVEGDIATVEDKLLAQYEEMDDLKAKLAAEREAVRREEKNLTAFAADVEREVASLKETVAGLAKERSRAAKELPADHLHLYQRILQKTGDTALARVSEQYCGGCHVEVRPNLINLLMKGEELITCKNCSRILYL